MRLLLQKQKYHRQKPNCYKNISDRLASVMENVIGKKCILNYRKDSLQKQMIFFSINQTENPTYSFAISVEVNFLELLVIYKASLLKNSQIFSIDSKELRINLMQTFIRKKFNIQKQYSLSIDKDNGQIQLQKKIGYSKKIFQSTSQLTKQVQFKVKELIEVSHKSLHHILFQINESTKKTEDLKQVQNKEGQKIKRHIYFSCYDLGLSEKASEYRYPNEQISKRREKILKSLLGKRQRKDDPKQAFLYGLIMIDISDNKQWRKQFESDKYFQYLLQTPILKAANNENNCIYNQIKIESPEKAIFQEFVDENIKLKVMHTPITYLFNEQNSLVKKQSDQKPFFNKILLIKEAKSEAAKHKAKILHEKNIIKLFQFANSPYLFKYYNCNQSKFVHKYSLLMDYSPFSITLLNHLSLRRESLSIQSKLNILSHISNGLRFLTYYKVVHMDLSLSNIVMVDGHLPKIIDFGESYNRDVVQKNASIPYTPGFSVPYCPPQVFTQNTFTTSQDMYSFGIILFRVLMNTLPLSSSDQTITLYKNKVYHQRLYFCPEKISICQEKVIFLLFQLINTCLRTQQQGRPLPIWSTIILKQIIANLL